VSRYKFNREQVRSQGTQSFIAGTGAVSRHKLSRSRKIVKVQAVNCGQMRVSGCNGHYKSVLGAGANAKTVTSLLIIPSVLYVGFILKLSGYVRTLSSSFFVSSVGKAKL